jgi:aminomethyltransferase
MGQVLVTGKDSRDYLQHLVTSDVKRATQGKGIYAHLLNEKGGVIDDLFVYKLEDERYLLIVNASRTDADVAWMKAHTGSFEVEIELLNDTAALALQGPRASAIMERLSPVASMLPRHSIGEFSIANQSCWVARTGYTGEDGFEIFGAASHMQPVWDLIWEVGPNFQLAPAGLGARDTLRTEVAYPLYGHELDEARTPVQAGLSWVVAFDKGDFIGREPLIEQRAKGVSERLVGFKIEEGGVARPDALIFVDGIEVGKVTSGTFSPSLGFPIGLGYVPAAVAKDAAALTVRQGAREMKGVTAKTPFYRKPIPATA